MQKPLYLIACSAGKLDRPAPARDLYTSDLFRKSRAYVEALGAPWKILSAKHGLVDPDTLIAPYDVTLIEMTALERMQWGEPIAIALSGPIVFLAGRLYRDSILERPPANQLRGQVSVPMEGLGIGQQKAWLARAVAQLQRGKAA